MAETLHLRMVTPDRTVVDRAVAAVSFQGLDGSYGILPHHAPLVCGIAKSGAVKITETDGRTVEVFASDGFAQMQDNVLTMVCLAGELAVEIDLQRVKAAEQKAREKLSGLDRLSAEFLAAEAALRRAMTREMLGRRASGTGGMN